MIISQTPFRVSLAGGGTDLPAFYRQEYGAALSSTIDQHIYVTIHRLFEPTIRVGYSRTEVAATLEEVQDELVRESMRMVEIDEPPEITTIGGHQNMISIDKFQHAYMLPHLLNRAVGRPPFEEAMIIGAGSGNDVAAAL